MQIRYKPTAVKQIKKLQRGQKRKIIGKIELLSQEPRSGKKLRGELTGLMSARAWPYRIIYKLEKNTMTIFSVAHRQSAYK